MPLADFFRSKVPLTPTDPNKPTNQQTPLSKGQQEQQIRQAKERKPNDPLDTGSKDFAEAGDSNTKNPLDSFAGMYDNKVRTAEETPPVFALDPTLLKNAASQLNFSSHVTPELVQKLQSGDATAVAEAFNELGRQVYQTTMSHSSTLTDKFVGARMAHDRKGLGQSVHSVLTANSLAKLAEQNPTLKEHVTEIGDKIASKYPDATPDWIAEQTKNYFVTVAKQLDPSLTPKQKGADGKDAEEDINWEEWMTAGSKN